MDVSKWKVGDIRTMSGPADDEPVYARVEYKDENYIVERISRYDWTFSLNMLRHYIPDLKVEGMENDDILCFELWMRPRESDLKGFYAQVFDRSEYLPVVPPYFWPDDAAELTGTPRLEYATSEEVALLAEIDKFM